MSQNVNVNLTPGGYPREFHVSQYDVGRQLVAKVVDSTGDYSIPSGATAVLVGTKPSGFGFTLDGTVSGSTVTFSTTATVTAEYGRIPCEIRITNGSTILGTANCMLVVEMSPHPEGTTDGDGEQIIPELTLLVQRVEAAAESIHDLSVSATTLPAGSAATATYDEEENSIAFGIPRGADGEVSQAELDAAVSDLKSDLSEYGAANIIPTKKGTEYPSTLTIIGDGKGRYTINGTNSNYVWYDIFNNQSAFPNGINAGDTILLAIDDANIATINFHGQYYADGAWNNLFNSHETKLVTIPQNAVGLRIRLLINANTYNNLTVKPYIFADKTKFEYDSEIEKIVDDIEELNTSLDTTNSYLPHEYTPVELTTTRGLVSRWNETATPAGWYYGKIPVTSGEKYSVNGNFYGGNYPAYLILNGNSVLSYFNPTTTGAFYGLEITIPENATHLVVNGDDVVSPVFISKYGLVPIGATSYDSILVGKTDDYEYTDINTAVQHNIDSIISVDYGTYETEIENLATNKKVIGKDGDLCILTGTDKDYDHPPIEIAGGIVKNFTVTMINAESASHKGYCLHSDNAACSNNSLLVENCKFNCIGQHSVGMGIYPNEEVIFKNCRFENLGLEGTMPIYMHNSGASDGVAVVRFHNCYFTGQKYAMQLQGWGSNANIKFEFIDCTCLSVTYGTADDCVWTDYVSGSTHDTSRMHEFSGKFTLLPTSHGNNISVLNA